METFAPSGVDATEIALGPPCTMVAQPLSAPHAPIVASNNITFNIRSPGFSLVFDCARHHSHLLFFPVAAHCTRGEPSRHSAPDSTYTVLAVARRRRVQLKPPPLSHAVSAVA